MKTVLCYGDSNTWGYRPDDGQRFGHDIRWPRVLQRLLGDDYYVIESGLNARTTDLDDKGEDIRNGLKYLSVAVKSNAPLDILIVMLGTNDLKARFDRSAADIAKAVGGIVAKARTVNAEYTEKPLQVIIVAPVIPSPQALTFAQWNGDFNDIQKAKQLCSELRSLAENEKCRFVNANECAEVGEDGLHLTAEGHGSLAYRLAHFLL